MEPAHPLLFQQRNGLGLEVFVGVRGMSKETTEALLAPTEGRKRWRTLTGHFRHVKQLLNFGVFILMVKGLPRAKRLA